jgi:predicted short-subunit dehydrogenase-like oxidoreductase (DUF2520 family)
MAARVASDGLRRLNRATSDLSEARAAFERIAANGHRASKVADSVRSMVAKTERADAPLDLAGSFEKPLL